jgi:hypothetical protein
MAPTELSAMYARELRSGAREAKRYKDQTAKWAHGERLLPGCRPIHSTDGPSPDINVGEKGADGPNRRRPVAHHPRHRNSSRDSKDHDDEHKRPHVKGGRSAPADEVLQSKSIIDLLLSPGNRGPATEAPGDYCYSFDHAISPAASLPLAAFVKQDARGTEKLVEKEYEILDANGEAVRGKKARRTLRQASSASPETRPQPVTIEDDDFELV